MDVTTYLSSVNTRVTSRTKEGGRRRKYRLDMVRVGVSSGMNYVVPLVAKSVERFLAMEKLTASPNPAVYKDSKKEIKLLDSEDTVSRHYIPTTSSFSNQLRFKGVDCVFLDSDVQKSLPKTTSTISRSTKTVLGAIPFGKDISAEPIQYTILRQLGFKNMFVKNYGSRHKLIRVRNLVKILNNLESQSFKQRRLGCFF